MQSLSNAFYIIPGPLMLYCWPRRHILKMSIIYSNGFDIAAMIISSFCLMTYLMRKRIELPQHYLFIALQIVMILTCVTTILSAQARYDASVSGDVIRYAQLASIFDMLYFVMHIVMPPLLSFYILTMSGSLLRRLRRQYLILLVPCFITELLVLANPFLHMIFYTDAMGNYQRGPGMPFLYLVSLFYFVYGIALLYTNTDDAEIQQKLVTIRRKFDHDWTYRQLELPIYAVLSVARVPEDFDSPETLNSMMEYESPNAPIGVSILSNENMQYIRRESDIEHAINEALESGDQLTFARNLGIDYVQGYYFSPPLERDDFISYLRGHNTEATRIAASLEHDRNA